MSKKTIGSHCDNIAFFAEYPVSYEPLRNLDEADDYEAAYFLSDWFPRKAMWANTTTMKSYLSSFGKFFKWMHAAGRMEEEILEEVLETLKERKDEFLDAVDDGDGDW